MTPKPDGDYALLAPENRPRRQLTCAGPSIAFPAKTTYSAELAARECKYQFDAWVEEKMAAGKRKAS